MKYNDKFLSNEFKNKNVLEKILWWRLVSTTVEGVCLNMINNDSKYILQGKINDKLWITNVVSVPLKYYGSYI